MCVYVYIYIYIYYIDMIYTVRTYTCRFFSSASAYQHTLAYNTHIFFIYMYIYIYNVICLHVYIHIYIIIHIWLSLFTSQL